MICKMVASINYSLLILLLLSIHFSFAQAATNNSTLSNMTTTEPTHNVTASTTLSPLHLEDPSCRRDSPSYKNVYEFGYDLQEIKEVSIFSKTEGRFPSYVGYPCNVQLWKEFDTNFTQKALDCPFRGDFDAEFQRFVWTTLWNFRQTLPDNSSIPKNASNVPNTLLFQYICFSDQMEECVYDQATDKKNGSCDGICQCRGQVPVNDSFAYPTSDGVTPEINRPLIKTEGFRCGVVAGGLCIPKWDSDCRPSNRSTGYNETMEGAYKLEDFYFQCESNAGCHTLKRVCECAQGYSCNSTGNWFGGQQKESGYCQWIVGLGNGLILGHFLWKFLF